MADQTTLKMDTAKSDDGFVKKKTKSRKRKHVDDSEKPMETEQTEVPVKRPMLPAISADKLAVSQS